MLRSFYPGAWVRDLTVKRTRLSSRISRIRSCSGRRWEGDIQVDSRKIAVSILYHENSAMGGGGDFGPKVRDKKNEVYSSVSVVTFELLTEGKCCMRTEAVIVSKVTSVFKSSLTGNSWTFGRLVHTCLDIRLSPSPIIFMLPYLNTYVQVGYPHLYLPKAERRRYLGKPLGSLPFRSVPIMILTEI